MEIFGHYNFGVTKNWTLLEVTLALFGSEIGYADSTTIYSLCKEGWLKATSAV